MRKFLNTLYVLNRDAYLSLEGENIVLLCNKAEIGRVPLHTLEGIVCFSYPGASPALMGKCARLGVDLSFFSPQGRFLARAVGEERGNVLLRQTQYRIADSEAESCLYARNFILGKVYNARWVLERATRDHPQRVPVEQLSSDSESNWYQTASENPGVRKLLPLTSEKGVLLGRFPFRIARVEGFTRIGVLANGKRLLFLSRKDPLAESLSKEADCTVFYDEISQKDGISSGEYAIIRKDPAWTDGFSEIGENYMPQWTWKALPDGRISG